MTEVLTLPAASSPPEKIADWLELRSLHTTDQGTSFRDVIRFYKMGGVVDSLDEYEDGADLDFDEDEECESLAEALFAEVADRERSCGIGTGAYPFELDGNVVQSRPGIEETIYAFMALLSKFGKDAGPEVGLGAKLFEDVCAKAAEVYLGGYSEDVRSHVFGFPRRVMQPGFRDAIDQLCQDLGEGVCHHPSRPLAPDQKDAKLDIVAWREFADRRPGKLIVFGQCATGQDWTQKITELPDTVDWCSWWMADRPLVWPIRLFFVPHRIEYDRWPYTNITGGIFFDRCRIAHLTADIDTNIAQRCAEWSDYVLKENLRK